MTDGDRYAAVGLLCISGALLGSLGCAQAARGNDDGVVGRSTASSGAMTVALLSSVYHIEMIYESMTGPGSLQSGLRLLDHGGPPKLLWLTKVETKVVGLDGVTEMSPEFFCHSNLLFSGRDARRNGVASEFTPVPDGRLVTLIPGRLELALPTGFGIPVYSDETFDHFTMALNLNEKEQQAPVRFRTTISFTPQSALSSTDGLRPLFRRSLYGHESVDSRAAHVHHTDATMQSSKSAHGVGAATRWPVPLLGDESRTIHWLVAPGVFESRTDVTDQLELEENTSIHFATAHLHPYARTVSLLDKTSGKVIVSINSADYKGRRGVAEMETWTSDAGVPVFRDHKYELLTEYGNPTEGPIDAMAIVYIYLWDRRFAARHQTGRSHVSRR